MNEGFFSSKERLKIIKGDKITIRGLLSKIHSLRRDLEMWEKVSFDFIREGFNHESTCSKYERAVFKIGLWNSEKIMFTKYFRTTDSILDIGCGAGRTTVGLYNLGYRNIQGIDLSDAMVERALTISRTHKIPVKYQRGNAMNMQFEDESFNGAIFSFNGIMQIPGRKNREEALSEIRRILKPGGVFIFTTHDRRDVNFAPFWASQELIWRNNLQDKRLMEYGDMIVKKEDEERELYVHIPEREDVKALVAEAGFELVECVSRDAICIETDETMRFSNNCVFWVIRKM